MCNIFTVIFLLSIIISQYVALPGLVEIEEIRNQDRDSDTNEAGIIHKNLAMHFPKGIVPYYLDSNHYDELITVRIQQAMDDIEASSCVVFNQIEFKPNEQGNSSWLHITNPTAERDCAHEPLLRENGEVMIVIGFDCMTSVNLLHTMLHALGFKDEVSHPHRDQYIRIMWENIQPKYRSLFHLQQDDAPYKVVEYDPMSIMHFHDRAFSMNGGPTITPRVPGLLIAPSEKLSQLDVMKLRVAYGHECNKRKVGALLEKCKTVFHNSPSILAGIDGDADNTFDSVEVDHNPDYIPVDFDKEHNNLSAPSPAHGSKSEGVLEKDEGNNNEFAAVIDISSNEDDEEAANEIGSGDEEKTRKKFN